MILLGAHVPTRGGLVAAPAHGRAIGAEAIQIFTRNQVQWKSRPIGEDEASQFRAALAPSGVQLVLSHGSYLVNLASPDRDILAKSREAFLAEMARCEALGIPYLIFHPGAHMGAGERAGLAVLVASLNFVLERASGRLVPLLEVTAGQGSYLGHRFEHLSTILEGVTNPERLGICLDTCHLFAAGYDIASAEGYDATWASLGKSIDIKDVKALHLNDAKCGLGSRVDRHEAIGEGHLGLATFRRFLEDPRFAGRPMVLETPGPLEKWQEELRRLRGLITNPASMGTKNTPAPGLTRRA